MYGIFIGNLFCSACGCVVSFGTLILRLLRMSLRRIFGLGGQDSTRTRWAWSPGGSLRRLGGRGLELAAH
jgi:hypothetical protein